MFENVVILETAGHFWLLETCIIFCSNSLVLGGRPPRGDAEERDVVDDLPAAHVEDRVVRLPQEHRTHLVEPGVTQGLAIPCGVSNLKYEAGHIVKVLVTTGNNLLMSALVRQEVLDLLDGHLADVEVLLVPKHGLETPPALLIPEVGIVGHMLYSWSQTKISGHTYE